MRLYQQYATNNACYKKGIKQKQKKLMLHSTGANNPKLSRYVQPDDGRLGVNRYNNSFNTPYPGGRSVCVHAFIGKLADGTIATYQTLPWDMQGWHAGKQKGNQTCIGVEICEDNLQDRTYFNAVYKEAVELFAYLCKMFDLTEKDIICHSEGYKQGIASNHGDVMHWFPKHGKSMDTFRADVKALLPANVQPETPKPETAKPAAFTPYLVRITANKLNVRASAGAHYKINTAVTKGGVYTIVAEQNGWGKLKSGAGWISLYYTKKL